MWHSFNCCRLCRPVSIGVIYGGTLTFWTEGYSTPHFSDPKVGWGGGIFPPHSPLLSSRDPIRAPRSPSELVRPLFTFRPKLRPCEHTVDCQVDHLHRLLHKLLLFWCCTASSAVRMQGCYRDDPGARDLPVQVPGFDWSLTPAACISACRNASYSYAGVQVLLSATRLPFVILRCLCNDSSVS